MAIFTRDPYGLLVHTLPAPYDGGDTAADEWTFWLGLHLRKQIGLDNLWITSPNSFYTTRTWLESDGIIVRNPEPGKWWSNWKYTSRDQTLGAIICAGIYDKPMLNRLWDKHRQRWFFCSNGTDSLLFYWSVWLRAFDNLWLNWLLVLTDLLFLPSVLERCGVFPRWDHDKKKFVWISPDDVGDDRNMVLCLVQPGQETLTRKFLRLLYCNFRPQSLGFDADKHPIAGAFAWFFRPSSGGNYGLFLMWREIIHEKF
jgi:hypothetical protein